jgi:hypothetical protein
MTDKQVLDAIEKIQRSSRASRRKAERRTSAGTQHAYRTFGSSDVEQAARSNYVRRLQVEVGKAELKRRTQRARKLEDLRAQAGGWADLVPSADAGDLALLTAEVGALLKR